MTGLRWHSEGPVGAPVLVLLNSIGTTGDMWSPLTGVLTEQFRVVHIDSRGHGLSPAVAAGTPTTIADVGRDVLSAIEEISSETGVQRVHLAGLSLGGMTAMWLAAHHPDRVARLALLCTSAYLPPAQGWLDRAAAVRSDGMKSIADAIVARWVTPALAERDPDLMIRLHGMLGDTDPECYAQCCEAIAGLDLRPDLARIAAPTLVIAAAQDRATPPAHARGITDGIIGARLEIVDQAAHLATIEQPAAITQFLIEHFIAGGTLEAGYRTRRAVLGDAHVGRAIDDTTAFTAPFQEFITRYAWGDIWTRPGLTRRDRSIATLAALIALGAEHEIALHVRAALRNGLTPEEISEVLLHTALYAGLPRANRAFAIAQQVLDQQPERRS